MTRESIVASYRAGFGLLTLVAIGTQFAELAGRGVLDPLHFFSYFTIDSNLLAAAVFLTLAIRRDHPGSVTTDLVRGAAVIYMTVTGVVFTLLLSGTDVDTAVPWVNDVVHSLMPIVVVADWLLDPPKTSLTYRQSVAWLGFPLVWLVYTLAKGPIVGKYPYPFLDPANGGYGTVAVYCVAILVGLLIVSAAAVTAANLARGRASQPAVA